MPDPILRCPFCRDPLSPDRLQMTGETLRAIVESLPVGLAARHQAASAIGLLPYRLPEGPIRAALLVGLESLTAAPSASPLASDTLPPPNSAAPPR